MSTANNTIDKFGRGGGAKLVKIRGPPGIGFKFTSDQNYNIQQKRLTNIGEPTDTSDATTRNYVDAHITRCTNETRSAISEASNLITETLQQYTNERFTEEHQSILPGRESDLMRQMMAYIDRKLVEHTTIFQKKTSVLDAKVEKLEQLNAKVENLEQLNAKIKNLEQLVAEEKQETYPSLAIPPYMYPTREIEM